MPVIACISFWACLGLSHVSHASMPDICNVNELDSDCSQAEGWEEFLRLTCQHCEVAATCAPAQDLLDFVKRIWGRIQSCSLNCWPGLQAVATVHKQFTAAGVIQEEHHLPDCLPSWQAGRERDGMSPIQRQRIRFWRPLFPFPLLGAQQLLYSQLHPVEPRTLCSLPDAGMYISRRFIPRGDLWESKCAVRRSDVQLLTTCRSRRDRGGDLFQHVLPPVHAHQLRVDSPAASSWSQRFDELRRGDRRLAGGKCLNHINETCVSPASCGFDLRRPFMPPCQAENVDLSQRRQSFFSLRCPNLINESAWWGWEDDTEGSEDEGNIGNMIDMKKYRIRASDGGCQSQRGTWSADVQDALKCVLVVIAERFSFRPGELLLEWGSGCGFAMSWAKAYYDVDSLGVDIMPAAAWAAKYSLGLSCVADGRKLQWIPNGLFDHVFSYGALRHLSFEEQCEVAHQLVRKLRIGGRAFIGWNLLKVHGEVGAVDGHVAPALAAPHQRVDLRADGLVEGAPDARRPEGPVSELPAPYFSPTTKGKKKVKLRNIPTNQGEKRLNFKLFLLNKETQKV